jgi:hypothetical protein
VKDMHDGIQKEITQRKMIFHYQTYQSAETYFFGYDICYPASSDGAASSCS